MLFVRWIIFYVPKGVKIEKPLQSYFRINTESMGQFERTLIIVDEGADIHYVEDVQLQLTQLIITFSCC